MVTRTCAAQRERFVDDPAVLLFPRHWPQQPHAPESIHLVSSQHHQSVQLATVRASQPPLQSCILSNPPLRALLATTTTTSTPAISSHLQPSRLGHTSSSSPSEANASSSSTARRASGQPQHHLPRRLIAPPGLPTCLRSCRRPPHRADASDRGCPRSYPSSRARLPRGRWSPCPGRRWGWSQAVAAASLGPR